MTPEVWQAIREDWKQSLPDVIAGRDNVHYPYGWAQMTMRPSQVRRTANYIAWLMRGPPLIEILNCGPRDVLSDSRTLLYILLREQFPKSTISEIARRLRKDHSTIIKVIERGRAKLRRNRDFLARYEALKVQL